MEEFQLLMDEVRRRIPWLNSDELMIATVYLQALQAEQARYNLNRSLAKSGIAPVPPNQELNDQLTALGFPPIDPTLFERIELTIKPIII